MNVVKFLTKLYEGDSYLQAFLGKVAKDIEAGAPPIKAFADEAGRLSVVLGVQKAKSSHQLSALLPAGRYCSWTRGWGACSRTSFSVLGCTLHAQRLASSEIGRAS